MNWLWDLGRHSNLMQHAPLEKRCTQTPAEQVASDGRRISGRHVRYTTSNGIAALLKQKISWIDWKGLSTDWEREIMGFSARKTSSYSTSYLSDHIFGTPDYRISLDEVRQYMYTWIKDWFTHRINERRQWDIERR